MFQERSFSCGEFMLNGVTGPVCGPPLVFFHGVGRCWQGFLPIMMPLAARWSTIAVDFRGHGRSDRAGSYLIADHLRDAAAFLTAHVNEPAVIYGHSLGALVAAGLAAAMPDRVRAVILEDPPAAPLLRNIRKTLFHTLFYLLRSFAGQDRSIAEIAKELRGYLMPFPSRAPKSAHPTTDAVAIRLMAKGLKSCDPETLTPLIESRWLEGFDVDAVFHGIRCPAMLMRAEESLGGMLAKEEGDRLSHLLTDGTYIEWSEAGHLIHWQFPDAVARQITGFLEAI